MLPVNIIHILLTATFTLAHLLPQYPAQQTLLTRDPIPARLLPFRLDQVRLNKGLFSEKRDRIKAFLRAYDERRFLILFNNQAGRPNPEGLDVPGGWEDGGLQSGSWAGHFMSSLAQAYADQGEEVYKEKLNWMVRELAECQRAITARMWGEGGGGGGGGSGDGEGEEVGRVKGRFGNALRLGGESPARYVTLPQETVNQLRDFTIAAWVNIAEVAPWSRLFDFGHGQRVNMFFTPHAGVAGNIPRFAITVEGSEENQIVDGDVVIPTGRWVHVAVTLGGGVGTIYVDGKMAGRNGNIALTPADLDNPGNRWIGKSNYVDALLDGTVDEFHIFDRALSVEDINSLQTTPDGTTGGGNIAWYTFDEETGTTVADASPNGRDAGVVVEEDKDPADWIPTHPGYLGALPEDVVLRLGPPRWAVYGADAEASTWAAWYTQHKIMRGLLDAYYHTNNTLGLGMVTKMADWAYLALTVGDKNHPGWKGNLTRDDWNYMWDLYIGGEYGGVNEVLAEVYGITGDERHLAAARAFDNRESLFGAAVADHDILVTTPATRPGRRRPERLHANQHVPQFLGYVRVHENGGGEEYLTAARSFYTWVIPHRVFAPGGTGGNYPSSSDNSELFQNRDNIANAMLRGGGSETCTTYNLLKLGRALFMHTTDAGYMDEYERALFNMIPGSRRDGDGVDDPGLTYFQPVQPGAAREYGNTGTCCGGTGLESHTKYQETVYFRSVEGDALWVNLFVPSVLTWSERGVEVRQETDFPRGEVSRLKFTTSGPVEMAVKIRVPGWAHGFTAVVNGQAVDEAAVPGSYLTITRAWQTGDVVEIHTPFTIRVERARDRPDTQALLHGPVVLQLVGRPPNGTGTFWELSLYRHLKLDGDYSAALTQIDTAASGDALFSATATDGTTVPLRPYYISDGSPVSSYFRRVEPTVIFGPADTNIPNRRRNDGLPRYDVPVSGVASPGTDGPTFLDIVWDDAPFATHGLFVDAVARAVGEFVALGVYGREEGDAIVSMAREAEGEL